MVPGTRFVDPAAVDAWDRWFRWRHAGSLYDRTIDATWQRVADAIAGHDKHGMSWAHRYVEAFSHWLLLPDERLLRAAGTGVEAGPLVPPSAALNVAAFVVSPQTDQARFDDERFSGVAALAVRLLDDALVATAGTAPSVSALHIGLIGFGDALQMLGIGYDDAHALAQARTVGRALAIGTLRGTTELARERGSIADGTAHLAALCRDRDLPLALVEDAKRQGVRHARLTAIERQPRLALLANNASDALDPSLPRQRRASAMGTTRRAAAGMTMTVEDMMAAQLAIRAAIQPWIDAPIDYPLATVCEPVH